MDKENVKRELEKVLDALVWAMEYFEKTSEANAALHKSSKVMYTPLASEIHNAFNGLSAVLTELDKD